MQQNVAPLQESSTTLSQLLLNEASISNTDHFFKLLSEIQAKGAKPELVGSIITHYASKWLPDLAGAEPQTPMASPKRITASWAKKKFFIENLVSILPTEKNTISCNFLLRLLRVANMVGVAAESRAELEKRVSWQLDQASLEELMIPCFSHDCTRLLDVELILRLVMRFVGFEDVWRSGAALMKVAKLVDGYLAEAAIDSHLGMTEFVALAGALPRHARSKDDALYRAIDIYLKAHPGLSKQDRKRLCNLLDSRKLSTEASLHAARNERLPVRAVIQVLLSEQNKLSKHIKWSGSLSGTRSPLFGLDAPIRCLSKREMMTQQMEINRLKEDVLRLQSQCMDMERQIANVLDKKKVGYNYHFSWKKIGIFPGFRANKSGENIEGDGDRTGAGLKTPIKVGRVRGRNSNKWRESLY